MSSITREFTKEQVVGHIRAKLDAHQNSTWPVSMASSAQMEKQILESALAALAAPPAPISVPDAISTRQAIAKMENHEPCDSINVAYKFGWNACRAAMLQGAEQTNYRGIVERIAEIVHGKVTDIDLLTVTVKSMKDKLHK